MVGNRDDFTDVIKREVASWSNHKCMICGAPIERKGKPKVAHIVPAAGKGPRSELRKNPLYGKEFVTSKKNALLLCAHHHEEIDNGARYGHEELFGINKTYREKRELVGIVSDALLSDERREEVKEATKRISKYLNISDEKLDEEIRKRYNQNIFEKIKLKEKIEKNELCEETSRDIDVFVRYNGFRMYSALSDVDKELGNFYFLTAIKLLYMKLDGMESEQSKYDEMLKILKSCCENLNIDEKKILNYYFYICEVFKK